MSTIEQNDFSKLNDAYEGKIEAKSDLLYFARQKAKLLLPNCQVRLTAKENYYLLNMAGRVLVGYYYKEPCTQFFKNKPLLFINDAKGETIGKFQYL